MTLTEPFAEVISVISPTEDNLTLNFIGDKLFNNHIKQNKYLSILSAFRSFYKLSDPKCRVFTSQDLFNGTIEPFITQNSIPIYDEILSEQLIDFMTIKSDPLNNMLFEKLLVKPNQNKLILDISKTDKSILDILIENLDSKKNNYIYLISDSVLGLWFNNQTFIQ